MKPYRFLSPLLIVNLICSVFLLCLPLTLFAGDLPIPDTGQTTCYDDEGNVLDPCPSPGELFYGQDANYSINPHSYTKLRYGGAVLPDNATPAEGWIMTRDNVTGLIWELKTDDDTVHDKDKKYDWYEAASDFIDAVNAENFGGFSDWRLPSIQELSTLVNAERAQNSIDLNHFANNVSSGYWSSTTYALYSGNAWRVLFDYGGLVYDGYKSYSYYARAVRGGQ